ncbi:M16 family metallopeptidase [Sphingomonas sp. Leaf21]|uniref:M16 family metallopeptidase n=1 Tax=Sphingomonas sp. Leaf21 TaxID=2876550 RepID=UPI001E2AF2AD|nr:insulinase family protein [Sphingomonas sp. Leaf21]
MVPTAADVESITRADLQTAFTRWVRPEKARLVIVSDEPLATLMPRLNASLGRWTTADRGPVPTSLAVRPALVTGPPRIVLIDMPGQVQASIMGGQLIDLPTTDEALAPQIANIALGGGFLSRINMNLREDKHWSYGASGRFDADDLGSSYQVETQVQPDKVGPAIREIQGELNAILTDKPITPKEFEEGVANILRQATASYRMGGQIQGLVSRLQRNGWPIDFYDGYSQRLQALTIADAQAALRRHLQPSRWVWAVTGDAKLIRPQLEGLGVPVDVITPTKLLGSQ